MVSKLRKRIEQRPRPVRERPREGEVQYLDDDAPPSVVAEMGYSVQSDQAMHETRYYRPSMIGGCLRMGAFHYIKHPTQPQRIDTGLQFIFDNGSAVHEVVQKWLSKSQNWYVAPEVHVWVPGLEVFGHADAVVLARKLGQFKPFLIEVKSINKAGYQRLAKPQPDHVFQANTYAGLLGLEWFVILYWNKDNQQIREFKVKFDPDMFEEALEWCDEIGTYVNVKKRMPPYREEECTEKMCRYVKWCKDMRKRGDSNVPAW